MLQQQNDDCLNDWVIMGYWSTNLTKEQPNYSASERECYSVVCALLSLRPYVEGTHYTVRTEHYALKCMMKLSHFQGRLV